jgi:four helix bundle protein
MKVKDYKELKVWQQGIEIVDKIYSLTDNFPKDELYGLTNQMRRSALSIPSNISEGFVRNHSKEYIQFLHISLGSCAELETQLIIAHKRNYITQDNFGDVIKDLNYEMRMLVSMIKAVQRNL